MTDPLELRADIAGLRLVLARHGETPSNVRKALDTLPPGPELTELGRRQAEQLAARLATEQIMSVHASKAVRAQQTAAALARRHDLPVEIADGTQEVQVGELEGTTDPASRRLFEDTYASWHFGALDTPMPGGESGRQALTRFLDAVRRLLLPDSAGGAAPSGSVAMVSHGAMVRLVAGHLSSNVDAERANAAYLPNTGIIVLESDPAAPTGWTCTHWDGLDADGPVERSLG